ncbi:MAG: SIMPL domain-containing protein [Bacteroidales bacterium]|nr:SIMPL domain-containing protein [Bacteroidales bacterium]
MKKRTLFILIFLISVLVVTAQNLNDNKDRTISVTGSASMNVMPDEIIMSVSLEEYWEEQFLPNTNKNDYKTKVSIDKIENIFFEKIDKIGIPRDSILLVNTTRNWLWNSVSVIQKNYNISIINFETADKILIEMDFHGIKSTRISELKNKNIPEYREDVKKQAMLAAKNKAAYLLETIDEELGRVISIRERSHESGSSFYRPSRSAFSNVHMGSAGESKNEDNFRSIPLRYEIEAVFEIRE